MSKKTTKSFTVNAVVKVWTHAVINAETLEDAVVKARELTVHDFVRVNGDHLDSRLRITGVDDTDWESVDE